MKNGAPLRVVLLALLALPGAAATALEWQLPVTTLRFETSAGSAEEPEEETILPSSERFTVSLRIREEADPAVFGITFRGSWKDYFQQSGDYAYVEVEQDGSLRPADRLKLGYALGAKNVSYPQPDSQGLLRDALALKAGTSAALTIVKGTTLEAGLAGRWELAANSARSQQAYVVSASFGSRIGEWLFGARYRGEFRVPLGSESGVTLTMYHTGGITLEWDPNP